MTNRNSDLLDPDCRDGKHTSCIGPPCMCTCHPIPADDIDEASGIGAWHAGSGELCAERKRPAGVEVCTLLIDHDGDHRDTRSGATWPAAGIAQARRDALAEAAEACQRAIMARPGPLAAMSSRAATMAGWIAQWRETHATAVRERDDALEEVERLTDTVERERAVSTSADRVIRAVLAELGKEPDADPVIAARRVASARDQMFTGMTKAVTEGWASERERNKALRKVDRLTDTIKRVEDLRDELSESQRYSALADRLTQVLDGTGGARVFDGRDGA